MNELQRPLDALVLDFDGVVSDSAGEAFRVALTTYRRLLGAGSFSAVDDAELEASFLGLMPLGNRAEDFGVALAAIEAGVALDEQSTYDAFKAARPDGWIETFHREFYLTRRAWSTTDPRSWLQAARPYPEFVAMLRRRQGTVPYAIATAKDRRSVDALLQEHGLAGLFDPRLIFDKETGVSKTAHLTAIRDRLDVEYGRLTFVDDKVNHLDAVAALGVRCGLSAWGYNGERERKLAAARGYLVCTLTDAETLLFGD